LEPPGAPREVLADLSVRPFELRVVGFRTRPLGLGIGQLQVQQAAVEMPEVAIRAWRGTPNDLIKNVCRAYAATLARDMPWFVRAVRVARQALVDSLARAVASSVATLRYGEALRAAEELWHSSLVRGQQALGEQSPDAPVSDFLRGVARLLWWPGYPSPAKEESCSSCSPDAPVLPWYLKVLSGAGLGSGGGAKTDGQQVSTELELPPINGADTPHQAGDVSNQDLWSMAAWSPNWSPLWSPTPREKEESPDNLSSIPRRTTSSNLREDDSAGPQSPGPGLRPKVHIVSL